MSFYPRQCDLARCGTDAPLVPSRGQAIDHVAFSVADVGAWHAWIRSTGATILEPPHEFAEGAAFMFEGPDRLSIELVQVALAPPS